MGLSWAILGLSWGLLELSSGHLGACHPEIPTHGVLNVAPGNSSIRGGQRPGYFGSGDPQGLPGARELEIF